MFRAYSAPLALIVALLLAACSNTPPVQQMSDARLAISAAEEGDADKHAPEIMREARERLRRAEQHLKDRAYIAARSEATRAKQLATEAREQAERAAGKPRRDDPVPIK